MITGSFRNLYLFTIIILIHELGHYSAGKILKWNVYRIEIYPYGGCTKFDININTSMLEELFVLISGPLLQMIFYLLLRNYLSYNDYILFRKYNFSILFFNMMPIYPLDGGRLLNLFFSFIMPYKKSLTLSANLSILISVLIIITCSNSLSFSIVIVFIIVKIYEERKKINFYYNKFLLERYMNKYNFKGLRIINNVSSFYKSKRNLIKKNNHFFTEKEVLRNYFKIR